MRRLKFSNPSDLLGDNDHTERCQPKRITRSTEPLRIDTVGRTITEETTWRHHNDAQLHLGFNLSTKRTRKREFLDEMRRVAPWSRLIALIQPHYPKGETGRPPFLVAT